MKCACCGKRKGIFESYEELDKKMSICVNCSKLLYKYQDAKKEGNNEDATKIIEEIERKKSTKAFQKWLKEFMSRFSLDEVKQEDVKKETNSQ